jgi:hypothetical protein
VKRSWRRRLLGRLVCAQRGHRPVPFRTEPKHPGVYCSRCLEVRGGGRWVYTGNSTWAPAWTDYAPGDWTVGHWLRFAIRRLGKAA